MKMVSCIGVKITYSSLLSSIFYGHFLGPSILDANRMSVVDLAGWGPSAESMTL